MKVFIVLLASVLAVSAIDRPDEFLMQLNGQKNAMRDYQTSVFEQIRVLRAGGSQVSADFIDNYLSTAGARVNRVGSSDYAISSELEGLTAGPCVTSLQTHVESILQVSGFAITNCYDITDPALVGTIREMVDSLNQLEQKVAAIELIIPDTFLGRNVFTQSAEIISLVTQEFEKVKAEYDALLAGLQTSGDSSIPALQAQLDSMTACFTAIDESVASGYAYVQSQIPTCTKFGTRGARSMIPFNVKDYFPQLQGEK